MQHLAHKYKNIERINDTLYHDFNNYQSRIDSEIKSLIIRAKRKAITHAPPFFHGPLHEASKLVRSALAIVRHHPLRK